VGGVMCGCMERCEGCLSTAARCNEHAGRRRRIATRGPDCRMQSTCVTGIVRQFSRLVHDRCVGVPEVTSVLPAVSYVTYVVLVSVPLTAKPAVRHALLSK
jgi:hypothetical protein